jgi:TonB-dependent receptor
MDHRPFLLNFVVRSTLFVLVAHSSLATVSQGIAAEATDRRSFTIPAGEANATLKVFAKQSKVELLYSTSDIAGVMTNAVDGSLTSHEALSLMLKGTDLEAADVTRSGAIAIRWRASDPRAARAVNGQTRNRPSAARNDNSTGPSPTPMKRKTMFSILAAWLGLSFGQSDAATPSGSSSTAAATAGTAALTGIVTNAATGRTLEGARVILQGTGREVLTDRDGTFRLSEVPEGPARITVFYTGLDAAEISVPVTAGTNRRDVALTSGIYKLEKFVVAGEREGNAQAITIQRNSTGVKTVVSTDAFGSLGANPADLLARLPGVFGETDGSAIRYVRIRGMDHVLNSVTLDGNRLANAASAGSSREFQYTQIGADSIGRIEVVKSPTPDMDADSIGGAVNLVSRSAFDQKGRRLSAQAGAIMRLRPGATGQHKVATPSFAFSYSEVFKDKIGISINYGDRYHYSPTPASSRSYEDKLADPAYTYSFGLEDYFHRQHRWGGGIKLDYRLSEHSRFYLNRTQNWMIEPSKNHYTTYSTAQSVATLDATGNLTGTGAIVPGYTRNRTEWRPVAASQVAGTSSFEYKDVEGETTEVGGVHKFPGWEVDYSVYRSLSITNYPHNDQVTIIATGIGIAIEESGDRNFPRLIQTAGPGLTNPDSYQARRDLRVAQGKDVFNGAALNVKRTFATAIPFSIKAGARLRAQKRDLFADQFRWWYVGPDGISGPNPATGRSDDNLARFVNPRIVRWEGTERYPLLPFLNWSDHNYNPHSAYRPGPNFETALKSNPELFSEDVEIRTRTALANRINFKETISAAYAMGNVRLGRLDVTTGFRVEKTETEGNGSKNEITPAEAARRAAWVGVVTPQETIRRTLAQYSGRQQAKGDYTEVFPHLHLKYGINERLLARASFATNIGRPSIGQLIPNTSVNHSTRTLVISNPSLKPQFGRNVDVSLEYYFEPAGLLSVGVFLKDIKQFIFTRAGNTLQGNEGGDYDQYAGYTYTSQFNGGSAKVRGLELAYQQQFTFLPGFLQALGAYANYSRNETEGNYGGATTTKRVAGFIPETANVGISYLRSPWNIRLQYNYAGRRLSSVSASQARLSYFKARGIYDLKTVFTLTRNVSLYFDVWNIFDEQEYTQEWEGGRVGRNFRTGRQLIGGINWKL